MTDIQNVHIIQLKTKNKKQKKKPVIILTGGKK